MTLVNSSLVDALFNSGFEEPAEVHLETGVVNVQCHYYDKYMVAKMFDKDAESSSPMAEVKTKDVPGVKQGNKFVCRETEHFIHDPKPDGEGFTQLTLYYGND